VQPIHCHGEAARELKAEEIKEDQEITENIPSLQFPSLKEPAQKFQKKLY